MKNKAFALLAVALLLLGILVSALSYHSNVTAAPVAGPTPASVPNRAGPGWQTVVFFDRAAVNGDRSSPCIDTAGFSVADIQYQVIQSNPVNTTTLTVQYTNRGALRSSGVDVATTITQTTSDMVQVPLFGRQTCIFADVASTQTVTILVDATLR